MKLNICTLLVLIAFLTGCASVDVTKTAKGSFAPTNPNDVEILYTRPTRNFEEIASISAVNIP